MNKLSSEVQDVDRCVKCDHQNDLDEHGRCKTLVRVGRVYSVPVPCSCKCEFPSPSVSEAEDKNSGEGGREHRAVPRIESATIPKLNAAQTPTPNDTVEHAAAGNLVFLLSVIRCGESLSKDEEAHVREVIERLGAISPFPLESDVQKKIVEIRERQARRSHWKQPRPNLRYPDPKPDIDALLSIIDTLHAEVKLLRNEVLLTKAGRDLAHKRTYEVQQTAAANMKAELIKRVREEMSGFTPESIERFAAKLEAVELTQDTESSKASHNPEVSVESSVRHQTESSSESTLVTVDEVSKALEELREMFPTAACSIEHSYRAGFGTPAPDEAEPSTVYECCWTIWVNSIPPGEGATLSEAIAKVREWHDEVSKEQDNAKS